MTCVVAVTNGKDVFMRSDNMICFMNNKAELAHEKIVERKIKGCSKSILLGCSGNVGLLNILKYMKLPEMKTKNHHEYMNTVFIKKFRKDVEELNMRNDSTDFLRDNSNCLIGFQGSIYFLTPDTHLSNVDKYQAVGSGAMFAIGALHHYFSEPRPKTDQTYQLATRIAMEAASAHDCYVGEFGKCFKA